MTDEQESPDFNANEAWWIDEHRKACPACDACYQNGMGAGRGDGFIRTTQRLGAVPMAEPRERRTLLVLAGRAWGEHADALKAAFMHAYVEGYREQETRVMERKAERP